MENKITFEPDEELIAFANDFSKKFTYCPDGEYDSSIGSYKIIFQEDFDNLLGHSTVIRIGNESTHINFRRKDILHYSSDFIFYLIIWLHCVNKNQETFQNNISCIDKFVMDICVRLGKNRISITKDILQYLKLVNKGSDRSDKIIKL